MLNRSLALGALALAASANPAAAQCCSCAIPCAAPAPITIWGLSPAYGVNQGPVYSGPGYTTLPSYEGEASTADYPYVGYQGGYGPYSGYPDYRPYDGGRYTDPYRRHVYSGYWRDVAPDYRRSYYRDVAPVYRHGFYRHVGVPGPLTVSVSMHGMPRMMHRFDHDWRYR
jgi:hypothetical protein